MSFVYPSLAIVIRRSLARQALKAACPATVVARQPLPTDMSGVGHQRRFER